MAEIINLLTGVLVLALGFPLGNWLASLSKEEIKSGQRWFKIIIILSLMGGILGFLTGNDAFMFSMFFVAIVTSRSLKNKKEKIKKRK